MENRLHRRKGRNGEIRLQATAIVQARDDGDADQGRGCAGDER